jgi:hypothetical protein
MSALVANIFIGFWEKSFHSRFSFGGAISTLARQGGRSIQGLFLRFIFWFSIILERVWRFGFIPSVTWRRN